VAAWVNYVRCHDDIGWGFANDDVEAVGFDPDKHRHFLTQFYTGKFPGSFARGLPFQEDPVTGQARVSGTCASLAGLERAIELNDEDEIDHAIRRILLLHGVIMTIGGIPLIYLGDELGMLNDYSYQKDSDKLADSRWVHRPTFDWDQADARRDYDSIPGRVYDGLSRLTQLRRQHLAFSRAETEFVDSGNPHVLGYFRNHESRSVLVLANFSDQPQSVEAWRLRQLGLRKTMVDLVSGKSVTAAKELELEPYDFSVWDRPG
jgi:amylosucrase/maltose alpha-D-glucosyltransferase/alpha-amylase